MIFTAIKLEVIMKYIKTLLLSLTLFLSTNINAGGWPVFDAVHNGQTTLVLAQELLQTAKQVEEYKTQLDQYVQQMKDAAAPALYVWDKANATINKIRGLTGTVDGYINKYGNIDRYLSKFQDLNYWKNSPCYKFGGCTAEELQEVHDAIAFGSESQNESNSDFIRVLQQQQDALEDDAETLGDLQDQAQDADGHMKALQAANQLASAQANQMLQLRSGFNAFANAIIQRQQALQAMEAQAQAAGIALRRDTTRVINSDDKGWGF
jgi:type IV secretion system protein TrbJ